VVELTRDHVRYALAVASRIHHPDHAQRDSDALFALLKASRSYDGGVGTFLGYAAQRVVWAVQDGLRRVDHLSRTDRLSVQAGGIAGLPPASWGDPVSDGRGEPRTLADIVAAPGPHIDAETQISVQNALAALDTRGALVVRMRYHDWTGAETAEFLGVSEARISQLYRQGLNELRAVLGIDSSVEMLAA
jgi:RNA polymerase sigma factor (sigma-70 family)